MQKIVAEARVSIPEEEMLLRLRKVLMKKGSLSKTIINSSPGLPSMSSYLVHFGALRNIYRLIGYSGNQGWFDKYAAHQRWVALQLGNAARLRDAFEKLGRHAGYAASSAQADNVSSPVRDDTKLRWDETVFRTGADIGKPALDTNSPLRKGRKGP